MVYVAKDENWNSNMRTIYVQLDSSNYCTFTILLHLGVEEAALIVENKIRLCSIFTFISNDSTQIHLIDFSIWVIYGNTIRVHSNDLRP